jgi:transcriptional regulator of arginine metabolism
MGSKRSRRQELILSLIAEKPIRNQNELLRELQDAGIAMTQSTLSRELKTLGIAKAPDASGGYRYVGGQGAVKGPMAPVAAFVRTVERSGIFVVVKTPPGNAQGVARALDEADWAEVMGTIAGDDTILVICRGDGQAQAIAKRIETLVRR